MEAPSAIVRYLIKALIAVVLTVPTVVGTLAVARTTLTLLVLVLLPTLLYVVWSSLSSAWDGCALLDVRRTNTTVLQDTGAHAVAVDGPVDIDYLEVLNTVFWNYDGVQMASVFGGQVANPSRSYPRAITMMIALMITCYVLPIPATILNQSLAWPLFDTGSYVVASTEIGGSLLHSIMLISTFASAVGLYTSTVFCESTEIAGMADQGMLLDKLGHRNSRFRSPHNAIALTLGTILLLSAFETDVLMPVGNTFACLVAISIFAAGIKLRHSYPHLPRPTMVPGGAGVLIALSIIPIVVCLVIIGRTLTQSLTQTFLVVGCLLPGFIYGFVTERRERMI